MKKKWWFLDWGPVCRMAGIQGVIVARNSAGGCIRAASYVPSPSLLSAYQHCLVWNARSLSQLEALMQLWNPHEMQHKLHGLWDWSSHLWLNLAKIKHVKRFGSFYTRPKRCPFYIRFIRHAWLCCGLICVCKRKLPNTMRWSKSQRKLLYFFLSKPSAQLVRKTCHFKTYLRPASQSAFKYRVSFCSQGQDWRPFLLLVNNLDSDLSVLSVSMFWNEKPLPHSHYVIYKRKFSLTLFPRKKQCTGLRLFPVSMWSVDVSDSKLKIIF